MSRSITVHDIPDETADEMASRAAATGRSLQEYLRGRFMDLARVPDVEVWVANVERRLSATGGGALTTDDIVADASVAVAALVGSGEVGPQARRSLGTSGGLAAPALMPAEVVNVLRRREAHGSISCDVASAAHDELLQLRVDLHPFHSVARRVWQLRRNVVV